MSQLEDVGNQDGWRCWVCDEPVDPSAGVNEDRGPSVDARTAKSRAKVGRDFAGAERLAHRACNTRKGAVTPVIPWPTGPMIVEPAPLLAVAERLARKGGREVVARCPDQRDASDTAAWLEDRFSRLAPDLPVTAGVDSGGGQYVVSLTAARRR